MATRLVLLSALTLQLYAQPSITDIPQPVIGPTIFDDAGNSYVWTSGPITDGAYQTQNGGGTCLDSNGFFSFASPCSDAYLAKLDPSGKVIFGTYLGGSTADKATAASVDRDGNVFILGTTQGAFPVTAGGTGSTVLNPHTFAAKLSPDGARLIYATYLPATALTATAITTDLQGNAYIAGATAQTGYVLKLNAAGSAMLFNVVLPGPATALTRDGSGNTIVVGSTGTNNGTDGFIEKVDPAGNPIFARTFGGSASDTPLAVQTDFTGEIYLAGATSSLDLPTTPGVLRVRPIVPLSNWFGPGGFVAKLSSDGSLVRWSTYIPTTDRDQVGVTQLIASPTGDLYIAGLAGAGFPTTPTAPKPCFSGAQLNSGFVARLSSSGVMQDATYVGESVGLLYGLGVTTTGDIRVAWNGPGRNTNSVLRFGSLSIAWVCLAPYVHNSATFSGSNVISPGELISLSGLGIGPETGVGYQPDAQGRVPTQLANVQVLIDGRPIPILYAQSRQINAIVPMDLPFHLVVAAGQELLKVRLSVLHQGATVGAFDVSVNFGHPGLFRLEPGHATQAAAVNSDGTINGPAHPAAAGSIVSLWGTGFGPGSPACTTGELNFQRATGLLPILNAYMFTGGRASATYVGSAPGLLCGITQLNIQIPSDTPPGEFMLRPVSEASQDGAHISTFGETGSTIVVK